MARLMERKVKAVIDVPALAIPTGVHVEARAVIILGAPMLSGQLPGVRLMRIDGVYRSRRRPLRQNELEGEGIGTWRLMGEGDASVEGRGLGGAFFRRK
jgi:hypothetical protein